MPTLRKLLRGQKDRSKSIEIPFTVMDAASREAAKAYARANVDASITGGYVIDDIETDEYYPLSRTCKGRVIYKYDENEDEEAGLPDPTYSFNYTGGQIFRQVAIDTTCYGDAPDDNTLKIINFNIDTNQIDGVTLPILTDSVQWTKTVTVREANFSLETDLFAIFANRYKTNSAVWGVWPIDSVLYLGASGNLNDGRWTINYQFAVGANRTGATDIVPGISGGINKKAHEYVETWFKYTKNTNQRFKTPIGAKVHKVFESFSFSSLAGV